MLRLDASGRVAAELAGTQVLFDGVPAPLLYAYAGQVAVVVPFSVAGKSQVEDANYLQGQENYPVEFNVADAGPASSPWILPARDRPRCSTRTTRRMGRRIPPQKAPS